MAYAGLWILALAFGWIEASVVVYLREIYVAEASGHTANYLSDLHVTLISLPGRLVALEMAREACTLILLAAVAWLAGRRRADRVGAFLVSFGVWDLAYYAILRFVSGWPDSISTWDILFLIPSPWVAPVWAPVSVATLLVLGGSYLFWTSYLERRYRWTDIAVLIASVLLTLRAFLVGSHAVVDHRLPEHFPIWLFWAGVGLGAAWFGIVERRAVRTSGHARPSEHGHPIAPAQARPTGDRSGGRVVNGKVSDGREEVEVGCVVSEYNEAKNRFDALAAEAGELGDRLERLARGLSGRPERLLIGSPDQSSRQPTEWDIVPSHPLPSIESVIALTNDMRGAGALVEELRERLILLGRADLVEQPNGFFR